MADQSVYCPQHQGYITVGMSQNQVIAACGQPLSQQTSNHPIYQKVPVQQLFYNNQGSNTAFYGVWNLNTGTSGIQLQIDVIDNKVKAIKLNGSANNAVSICGDASIQVGDPVEKVYGACGNPSVSNMSYTNVPIESATKPVVWIYQPGQYQQSVSLTFIDGKLQSINN
jgi:hypothetical protein